MEGENSRWWSFPVAAGAKKPARKKLPVGIFSATSDRREPEVEDRRNRAVAGVFEKDDGWKDREEGELTAQ